MAFRAYFIRKSFTGIRKGQGRAFARPWPCVGGSASGNNAFRCIHSGSIRTNAARIVHIGDDLCTVHAGGKAHFVRQRGTACASGTEDENIVPGARPGLYVFLQHNGQTCTLHSIIQLDVGGDGILCGGAVDRAADRLDTACFADDLLQGASSFSIAFLNHCNVLYTRHPHDL